MLKSPFFRKYLLPGFVFQSIVIGGGYGTGRELVEYFMTDGPLAGLAGMLVATGIWSLVLAVSFELARQRQLFDYRTFINSLLGRGWMLFELVYVIGLIMVVSVMGSAAGEILNRMLGLPPLAGITFMILVVGVLAFFGTDLIENVLSFWSVVLYAVFILVIVLSLTLFGSRIADVMADYEGDAGWMVNGARYAAYDVGLMPAMLFTLRHLDTRREAMASGVIAGILAMAPGAMIYVSMLAGYPDVVSEAIPVISLITALDAPWLLLAFQIVLFGTFIETGVGLVHGFNERIAGVYVEKGMVLPARTRSVIAIVILVVSIFVANAVGLVQLIASGYGTLAWGYWLVFVIPVMTIGLWRILHRSTRAGS